MSTVANPLLSEFGPECILGRYLGKLPLIGVRFTRNRPPLWLLAIVFPLLGGIAALLSIYSRSSAIVVELAPMDAALKPISLHFGYLYELNAALFYLTASWIWVLAFLYFLRQTQNALDYLERKGRLTANTGSVSMEIGRLNRRWCSGRLLLAILGISGLSVVGSEFNPIAHKGDYWQLAFGYVQASAMPQYPLVRLDLLGRSISNKQTRNIRADAWRLASVSGGPVTPFERKVFPWFLVFAVGVETLFAPFAAWTVIKVAFILYVLYRALASPKYPVRLIPLHDDCERQFGFAPLFPVYRAIVFLVYVSMSVEIASVVSNVEKGSGRAVDSSYSDQLAVLLGQGAVTYVPIILLVLLVGFLLAWSSKLRSMHAPLREEAGLGGRENEQTERVRGQTFMLFGILRRFRLGALIYMFAPLLIRLKWATVSPWYDRWRTAADALDHYVRSGSPWR